MRALVAAFAAVCLVLSMLPAAALAEVTGGASSTVKVEVIGSLRVKEHSTWSSALSIADSKDASFDYQANKIGPGVIWAAFEYGSALDWDGTSGHYDATWTWQRTIEDGGSTTTTTGKPISKRVDVRGDERRPVAALSMNEMFAAQGWAADSLRAGTYEVKLALAGKDCSAEHTFNFTIVNADSVLEELTDAADRVTIRGAFSMTSELAAANLIGAMASEQQALLDALTAAAAPATVGAAFQLSIVNGGLFYDETPSFVQESVTFPVGQDVMQAIAEQRALTMLRSSGGALVKEVFRYDSASGTYKKVQPDGTLSATDALAIAPEGDGGMVTFSMPFTSAEIGAVALAYAPSETYTITGQMTGTGKGVASPSAASATYGRGAQPAYAFAAESGSVLAGIEVLAADGSPYPTSKYTRTADAVRFTGLDADARIVATFDAYTPPTDPSTVEPLPLRITQTGGAVGTITAGYMQLVKANGSYTQQSATRTSSDASFTIADTAPGTEVRLDVSAPEGYVIEGAWLFGSDVPAGEQQTDRYRVTIKGTTLVIPTMTADTANLIVRYAPGEKPPVTMHTVTGIVDGDPTAGSFTGMAPVGLGRYSTTVAQGDYQVVEVAANSGWAIAEVVLFEGSQTTGNGRVLMRAGAGEEPVSFSYTIPMVERDLSVVARFKEVSGGDGPIVIPDPEKSYTVVAKVNGAGGTISPSGTQLVRAGSDQTFTVVPNAGYDVKRVTANGRVVGLTQHASGYYYFTSYAIAGNLTIVATFERTPDAPVVTDQPASVSVRSAGLGRAYPAGTSKVAKGEPFTVTLEPDRGCALKSLTLNGADVTGGVKQLAYTVARVEGDMAFIATFVDETGSTIGPGTDPGDGDINIDVDIDIDVNVERALAAAQRGRAVDDEVGGEVTPMHVTIKADQTQRFIIKPFNGSYVRSVEVSGGKKVSEGPIPMGEVQPSPDGVNKPYYYVEVGQFTGTSVKLNVAFASCYTDPANTAGDRYIYDQAAGRVVDVSPSVDGDVEVEYPGNNPEGPVGDTIDTIVRPGGADPIDHIEMMGHTIDIVRDENGNITEVIVDRDSTDPAFPSAVFPVNPVGDKAAELDALEKAAEELNKRIDAALGYDPPRGQGENGRPDYVRPGIGDDGTHDGSFELEVPTGDKDGNRVDPDVGVGAGGSNEVLYQYLVRLAFADDSEAAGGIVRVERNGADMGALDAAGRNVPMNHEGALVLHAVPAEGFAVEFSVEADEGNIKTSEENTVALADLRAADAGEVSKSYVVTGPGTVKARFYKTGGSDGPDSSSSDSSSSGSSSGGSSDGDQGGVPGDGMPDTSLGAGDVQAGTAYAVTASAQGRGTISPSGTNYYRVGNAAAFNLVPQTGYQVSAVVVDGRRQAYTATKYTLAAQAGGTVHTVVAEFSPVFPAAGTTNLGSRTVRTLQSLAQTDDGRASLALSLAAVACAAAGVAILVSSRRRKKGAHAGAAIEE